MTASETSARYSIDEKLKTLRVPRDGALYYAMTLTADDHGKVTYAFDSGFDGFANKNPRVELRQPSLVTGEFVDNWKIIGQPYIIINDRKELIFHLLGGGNALVEQSISENVYKRLLSSREVIRVGSVGMVGRSQAHKDALQRAPSPKLRMKIINRDGRRCRICGRSPENNSDIVLNVHHIRPWEHWGVTDTGNLITLCHTCHIGLEPHQDLSIFEYLEGSMEDLPKRMLVEHFKGVANYRKIAFAQLKKFKERSHRT
jgi:HNH endonuclease